jgi:hypothetical protein
MRFIEGSVGIMKIVYEIAASNLLTSPAADKQCKAAVKDKN